ncbi:hypothetical protein ACH5RR_040158 [Cinchona calisaya]|uniref:Uncharacterized protein n=1 Tax=Cinchona calisaya TaxID=153742 RepID=A0ABD2XT23_9GENT
MSIQFKFRSSVNMDSVEIEGRSSISLRELKLKIIRHKNLKICQDFDLVFSDAASGQEYDDDNFQIPSGSNVIIKRVPARTPASAMKLLGSCFLGLFCLFGKRYNEQKHHLLMRTPIDAVGNFMMEGSYPPNPASDQMNEFDDLGVDMSSVPAAIVPSPDLELLNKNKCGNSEKPNLTGLRFGFPKLEPDDQAIQRVSGHHFNGNERNMVDQQRAEEKLKLEKLFKPNSTALPITGLPSELKCFLCKAYLKDAVMIPCCQHSFCDKCISQVLAEKARCPKCFSDKCKAKDLLPNFSLRKAIEHFLESQMFMVGSENAFKKYVPDAESGIQGNYAACAVAVVQRELELSHSPSATGKGSDQVIAESVYNPIVRRNESFGASEYHITNLAAGKQSSTPRTQKGYRTCYMCGSPYHLIRDCPASSDPHPMLQTGAGVLQGGIPGYASSYWNGAAYPPIRPFPSIYGTPAMIPFNASVVPVAPYGVPPYVPSLYGGLPTHVGIMSVETTVPPKGNRSERPMGHSEYIDVENKKLWNENLGRGQDFDVKGDSHEHYVYCEPERLHEYEVCKERDIGGSDYEDRIARRSRKKNQLGKHGDSDTRSPDGRHEKSYHSFVAGRDQKYYPSERSGRPNSSSKHSEEVYKDYHRSSRKNHERREQSHSDSSWGHRHQSGNADDIRFRVDSDVRGSHKKHDNYFKFGLEPSSLADQRKQCKDGDSGLESRHPGHETKRKNEDLRNNRWQMGSGSYEERRDDYHRKRKRVH